MFNSEDWPYWGALFLIGIMLGTLAALGVGWPQLLLASGPLYLAVYIFWRQRRGR